MALWKYLTKRVLFSVFAIYLVISVTFGFVALTADPNVGLVAHGAARSPEAQQANESEREAIVEEAIREYRESRNMAAPVSERYVRWLVDVTTLDWGESFSQNAPVTSVLATAIPKTLTYVVPAMLFALVGGIGLGVFSAMNSGSVVGRVVSGGFYLGFGIPNYWLALVVVMLGTMHYGASFRTPLLNEVVVPAAVLGTSLLAGQLRYARAESREYVNTEFLKLIRAKGASNRLAARHVLRNAALPLFSLFFADLMGVLVVSVFVLESPMVLGIEGIGNVGLAAIEDRDVPLILGVAMVFAFAGIIGNLLQDLAYLALDPRVDSD